MVVPISNPFERYTHLKHTKKMFNRVNSAVTEAASFPGTTGRMLTKARVGSGANYKERTNAQCVRLNLIPARAGGK